MRIPTQLLALPLLLVACGGGSDPQALADSGTKALNSGSYEEAHADFQRASELIAGDASNPQFKRVELGRIEAQAHLEPEEAKNELMALAAKHGQLLQDRDYSAVAAAMFQKEDFLVALDVVHAGLEVFPDSQPLSKIKDKLVVAAQNSGNTELGDKLKGLGYVGE